MSVDEDIQYLELRAVLHFAVDELKTHDLMDAVRWMSEHVPEPLWYVKPHVEASPRLQAIQRLKKALGLDYIDGPWMRDLSQTGGATQ